LTIDNFLFTMIIHSLPNWAAYPKYAVLFYWALALLRASLRAFTPNPYNLSKKTLAQFSCSTQSFRAISKKIRK